MSHDGEVFYYRSDRPVRTGSAVATRPPVREAYYEPEPPAPPAYGGDDRLTRLEQMVQQLEMTVTQLTQVIQGMAAQPARTQARPEPAVQYLRRDEAEADMAELGGAGPLLTEENVKVSMYAGSGATAIVGQIRVSQ